MSDIEKITQERGSKYGPFVLNAFVAQAIKAAMRGEMLVEGTTTEQATKVKQLWDRLPVDVKEALDLDAMKTSRIITGDPTYLDNYVDKQGYAKIVADRIGAGQPQPGTVEEIPAGWRIVGLDLYEKIGTTTVYSGTLTALKSFLKNRENGV